ncbi:MAG TPA: energy transducer TonB [Sphingomicrobium sp.]|nr:energy transducer TonB [Sphingomicrobium sp.]
MSTYRAATDRQDQAKAIAAVVAVHVALAFIILSGLNVRAVSEAVSALKTFNIEQPPPPPVPPPPPMKRPQQAPKKPQGAPAKKAEPSPIVAPPPRIPVPSPLPAAKVAGTGSASSAGAGSSGTGTGAGGSGFGSGGGGTGGTYTPARKLTKIPDHEYRRFAATGTAYGSVAISIRVNPDGSVSDCRIARSSGNPGADALMCQLTVQYVRFSPARDPYGRPISQDVTWVPNWAPR